MVADKRMLKTWNGSAWVEQYITTSDDLVMMEFGGTLREKVVEIDDHAKDTDLHFAAGEKAKLSKLDADADGTYATKTELTTHASKDSTADGGHLSTAQISKLQKLAADADATYATKEELAASAVVKTADDITALNQIDTGELIPGTQAWVADPSDDSNADPNKGTAIYVWDGDNWVLVYQFGGNVVIEHLWSEIQGKPDSTVTDIDDAVSKKHAHSNKATIDKLTDPSGELLYNGQQIGLKYSKVYMGGVEPTTSTALGGVLNVGDIWFEAVE